MTYEESSRDAFVKLWDEDKGRKPPGRNSCPKVTYWYEPELLRVGEKQAKLFINQFLAWQKAMKYF